ncbi:MAG: M15 family metallopeptidase [Thermodesulfovibrionales bacterium]|nr:M15 family metallopeptidase [Thermodesulfovibrionales bacterium]
MSLKTNIISEQTEFMLNVAQLIVYAHFAGFQFSGGELYRTKEQQEIYVREGKSMTMNSMHLNRLAIDINFFKDGKWLQDKESLKALGVYWESLNPKNKWGGNFKKITDVYHFERVL